jgi:hypothetical protein
MTRNERASWIKVSQHLTHLPVDETTVDRKAVETGAKCGDHPLAIRRLIVACRKFSSANAAVTPIKTIASSKANSAISVR